MNVIQHLVWHHQASLIPPNSDWLSASLYVVNLKKSLIMNMEDSISTRSMFVNAKNDLLWIVLIHCRGLKDITCSISTFKGGKTTGPLAEVCTLSQLFPTVFKQRNPPFYSAWVTSDGFSSAKVKTTTPTIPRCLHLLSCFYWETLHSVRLTFLNLLFTPSLPSTLSLSPSQYFTSVLVCSIFDERMIWQMLMKHSTRFSPVTLLHHPPPPHFLTVGQWGCSKCPSLATVINTDMTAELWYKMAPQL